MKITVTIDDNVETSELKWITESVMMNIQESIWKRRSAAKLEGKVYAEGNEVIGSWLVEYPKEDVK